MRFPTLWCALLSWCLPAVAQEQRPMDLFGVAMALAGDPDWLWYGPPPVGERCVQFSSYDRRSHQGPRSPDGWYANDDRGHYLRVAGTNEQPEHVMVDVDGPGCMVRLWSANPSGLLHFDIDGARVWTVDFGELCSGRIPGAPPALAAMRSRGGNVYLPIPFEKRLVVAATAGDLYYHADVVRWPADQPVQSFAPELLTTERENLEKIAEWMTTLGPDASGTDRRADAREVRIDPGQQVRFLDVAVNAPDDLDLAHALQAVRLVVTVGDERTVDVPLPDFFASHDWRPWTSLLMGVRADRIAWCAWPMAMPNGGSIELVTDEPLDDLTLRLDVTTDTLRTQHPMLFHADYHLQKGRPTRPFGDHLVLDVAGTGRLVGCSLLVRNPSRIWWGEGDEKVWVDGETFPSWFGTGTEDYFGYAWCDPTPFEAPLHAQVQCDGPMNFGFTQLHRTHLNDNIPFQRSLRFEFERWHWVPDTRIDYATVAYWYGAPGARSGMPAVPPIGARRLERLAGPPVFVAERALEGEALVVRACSGGTHEVQDLGVFERTFSRDAHRWWRDGKPGDSLSLTVPVATAGRYRVTVAMVRADDFGIVQFALNGEPLGEPIDGWSPDVRSTGPLGIGTVELPAGDAELRLTIVGRNEQAKPRHMVGLDYVSIEKVE